MADLRPAQLTLPDPPEPHLRGTRAGLALILAGVVVSVTAFLLVRHTERGRDFAEFERRGQAASSLVADGLQRHQDTLYALRNLFHHAPEVSRTSFAEAVRDLISRQSGVRALEWVPRVPGDMRIAFETEQRAQGVEHFAIWERVGSDTMRAAGQRDEYFPVAFIEPVAGNEPAFGFDLRSGITWPTLERIAGTGELAASGRLPLVTRKGERDWGYVMELPVYHQPLPANDPEERRGRLRGFVLGIFQIAEVLGSFLGTEHDRGLEVLFLDRSGSPDRQFLHFHGPLVKDAGVPQLTDFASGMHLRVPINHAGRAWELWFRPSREWLASRSRVASWLTLALGLTITTLIGSFVVGATRRERVVGRLVAERTAELRKTQAMLEKDNRERRETERQLNNVIAQLPGAAFRCAFDAKFTAYFASDGMFHLTGYAADDFVSGRISITDLTVPGDLSATRTAVGLAVEQRTGFEVEHRVRDREGKERHLLVRGRPIFAEDGALRFLEGLAIDVTALKAAEMEQIALERKMLEAQKLESLGVLAGGIAHDFNNLLTAMLGNATLARLRLPSDSPATEPLAHIEQAARRAAELCQQMLAYAGKTELKAVLISISDLVRANAGLLRVSIPKNTLIDLRLDEDLPAVLADPAQLQQIVMNLVINAADAIGENPGEIVVTTFRRYADAEYLRTALHAPELRTGDYVGLEVRDNGCGMPPETLARIFEPFFTTKFSGRGLGLAAVMGIVQSHRGALFVESEPGEGSRFCLLLQASNAKAPIAAPVDAPVSALAGAALIIDDEPSIREVLSALLSRTGMSTTVASSGDEALEIYGRRERDFELVLLDLTMPGLSGEETLRAIRGRNQQQRVIVMSGYTESDSIDRCAALGISGFVGKPFELPVLLEKIRATVSVS